MSRSASLERRVATAAGEVLTKEKAVTAVDVCVGTGWLSASHVEQDTDYDDLLMAGVPRAEARDQIRPAIDRLLATWSLPQPEPAFPRCLIVRIRLRGPAPCPVPGVAAATGTMSTYR